MRAGRVIVNIVAAILVFFGVLLVWGSTGDNGQVGWIVTGIILGAVGLVMIYFANRTPVKPADTNVTVNIDLPGNVNMDTLKCQSCGGTLKPEDIKMVAGAPVVTCPWCHTTYQLTEEPKW
jgi:Na+/melibiose symporter-like transporter